MTDIVERLRKAAADAQALHEHMDLAMPVPELDEAAAEIERLRAQVSALAKLLQPNPEQKAQAEVGRQIWEGRQ